MAQSPTSMRYLVLTFILVVTCIGAVPQNPEDGIRELLNGLKRAETEAQRKDSLEGCLVALTSLGSGLDMFELRYGVRPAEVTGWDEVKARAGEVLGILEARPKNDIYFNVDSANTAICILLELSGREKEALKRLDSIQPGGFCGNWVATVMQSVEQRKAGIFQRSGKYKQALAHEEAARGNEGISLYGPASDIDCVRYAFLLEKTKNKRRAIPVYQRVVDLYPGTPGFDLASKRLQAFGSYKAPAAERILHEYVKGEKGRDFDLGVYALARHRFAESFDILAEQLRTAEDWNITRVIGALGELGDRRAVPILQKLLVSTSDHINRLLTVEALYKLGDDSNIESFLRPEGLDENSLDIDSTDRVYRRMFDDGPIIENTWKIKSKEFSKKWIDWIREHRTKTKSVIHFYDQTRHVRCA